MRIIFKAKHTLGVRYLGDKKVEAIGSSKIDGFPLFSYEDDSADFHLFGVYRNMIFNQRPGYTPGITDFEIIQSLEGIPVSEDPFEPKLRMTERYGGKNVVGTDEVPVQPLNWPIGNLIYLDYVYESEYEFDNRLLLML